jgi:hypothetical protein
MRDMACTGCLPRDVCTDHLGGWRSRLGGPRATAHALIQKGRQYERDMDVRAAVRCYEVMPLGSPISQLLVQQALCQGCSRWL